MLSQFPSCLVTVYLGKSETTLNQTKYNNLKEWMNDDNNVYVGRSGIVFINKERFPKQSSKFANIYKVGKNGTREEVINKYKTYITNKLENDILLQKELINMKGKNLGCWCHPELCHANVLIELIDIYCKKIT